MKRIVFFLLCICAILLCLAACGKTPTTTTASCNHEFPEWETAKAASCTEKGLKVSICALCSEDKFEWIDMIPHKDENGDYRCDVCNVIVPYSEGLAYTLSGDGTYYTVSGIGSCEDTALVIPPTHEGLPVKAIRNYAFYYCDSLTSVVIGDSVTSIGDSAFASCDSLTSITIPDSVTSIGDRAFTCCASLINIGVSADNAAYRSIDGNLYSKDGKTLVQYAIGKTATHFEIPSGVTSIGDSAFAYCDSLTSVEIPDSVTSIGNSAFYSCDSLTSITIPDSVTSIGDAAFYDCDCLTSVTIPDSVTSIGDYAFARCGLTSVTIPDSVTRIGDSAFTRCDSLTSVVIGDSVTSIGNYAFAYCRSLTSVVIGDSVTSIGNYAFFWCDSLTSVTFENPNGWWYTLIAVATSGTGISAAELANTATAARYLRSAYCDYYWFRT